MPEPMIVYTVEDGEVLREMCQPTHVLDLTSTSTLRYLAEQFKPVRYYEVLSQWVGENSKDCQLYRDLMFRVPYEKLPLHINHKLVGVRLLVKWRLKIGK